LVIECHSLSEEELNKLCRAKGVYPHHVKQWKVDFASGTTSRPKSKVKAPSETKELKNEIRGLKKDLNRKNNALAETAALLVRQKKVNQIGGSKEEEEEEEL
jgi:transposase